MKTIRQWQRAVHQLAKKKGWYETERRPAEIHMLIVSEIAEATEALRSPTSSAHDKDGYWFEPCDGTDLLNLKPEGELIELADAVIRIMDYCEARGWDLQEALEDKHAFNKKRSFRHGGKTL